METSTQMAEARVLRLQTRELLKRVMGRKKVMPSGWDWAYQELLRILGRTIDLLSRIEETCSHRACGLELGRRISVRRNEVSLTEAQLAQKMGVSQTTVFRWENGVVAPSHRYRLQLALLLGGDPADYEE